jgi:hypothetical protein
MAEQVMIRLPGMVAHHGPVRPDCPVECLLTVLSRMSVNRLVRAELAPFPPPCTVGDVMDLYARDQLRKIRGLGRRRFSEIEAALVFAGLNLGRCQQPPAGAEGATR